MRTRSPSDQVAILALEGQELGCLTLITLFGSDENALARVKNVLALQSALKDVPDFDHRAQRLAFLRQVVKTRPSLRPKFRFPEDKNGPLQIKSDDAKVLRTTVREYVERTLRGELEALDRDCEGGDLILRLTIKDAIIKPNGEHGAEIKRLTQAVLTARKIEVTDVRVEIRGSVLDASQIH